MGAIEYIRRNAEVSVGTKQIHTLEGIDRAITFSVTLFAPYDSYTGMESTWEAARIDELLGAQCKDSAPAGSGEVTNEMVEAACDALDDACVAFHRDGHPNASIHWKGFMRADRNAVMRAAIEAALLRKLHQGVDGSKVLKALAEQFDEMSWAASRDGELLRRDVWQNAASQARSRAKDYAWIAASQGNQVADYVMVPREPTVAMVDAARSFSVPGYCIAAEQWPTIYRAMIAASQGQEGGHG